MSSASGVPQAYQPAYFEHQLSGFARCGLHSLNNALGGHILTADDMSAACTEYLAEMRFEGKPVILCVVVLHLHTCMLHTIAFEILASIRAPQSALVHRMTNAGSAESRRDHELASGWYSEAVLSFVLRWKVAQNELGQAAQWKLDLDNPVQPNAESLCRLHAEHSLGLIVNQDRAHWTAVRWEHGVYWLLDSLRAAPVHMTQTEALAHLKRYRHAFLVVNGIGG